MKHAYIRRIEVDDIDPDKCHIKMVVSIHNRARPKKFEFIPGHSDKNSMLVYTKAVKEFEGDCQVYDVVQQDRTKFLVTAFQYSNQSLTEFNYEVNHKGVLIPYEYLEFSKTGCCGNTVGSECPDYCEHAPVEYIKFKDAEKLIKCGDCNKFYRCTECDNECGSEGHFITEHETQDMFWRDITLSMIEYKRDDENSFDHYIDKLKAKYTIRKK